MPQFRHRLFVLILSLIEHFGRNLPHTDAKRLALFDRHNVDWQQTFTSDCHECAVER